MYKHHHIHTLGLLSMDSESRDRRDVTRIFRLHNHNNIYSVGSDNNNNIIIMKIKLFSLLSIFSNCSFILQY